VQVVLVGSACFSRFSSPSRMVKIGHSLGQDVGVNKCGWWHIGYQCLRQSITKFKLDMTNSLREASSQISHCLTIETVTVHPLIKKLHVGRCRHLLQNLFLKTKLFSNQL
jgi:hypothetical protein